MLPEKHSGFDCGKEMKSKEVYIDAIVQIKNEACYLATGNTTYTENNMSYLANVEGEVFSVSIWHNILLIVFSISGLLCCIQVWQSIIFTVDKYNHY